jgi:hypothetical protein
MTRPADPATPDRGRRTTAAWVVAALLGVAVGLFFPPLLPVVAIALIVGGVSLRRGAATPAERATATAVIAGGVVLLVVSLVVILGLVSVDSGGDSASAVAP